MTIDRRPRPDLHRSAVTPGLRRGRIDLAAEAVIDHTPTPDPLADVEYTGNAETDSAREMAALESGFKARAQAETERFRIATDSEFWFAVCFQSREQKDVFLAAMEWSSAGDKYIDGTMIASAMGIDLPKVDLQKRRKNGEPRLKKLIVPM